MVQNLNNIIRHDVSYINTCMLYVATHLQGLSNYKREAKQIRCDEKCMKTKLLATNCIEIVLEH